ncbi:MAG TPA: hypothetical protein VL285_11305 [Bryobacteraceae bacterium]|nr:hypothetical protein [Bryobacteraceae bacterium]
MTIKGPTLPTPVEITNAGIKDFTPWAGPGVTINGVKQTEGFIIDWKYGPLSGRPKELPRYEVSFYGKLYGQPSGARDELVHVVLYEYDSLVGRGYVYLPGKPDEWYRLNAAKMLHDGMEGNWFRATREWDEFLKPFIPRVQKKPPAPSQQ